MFGTSSTYLIVKKKICYNKLIIIASYPFDSLFILFPTEQARLSEQARHAAAVAYAKSSLFNTDPHTMKEPAQIASPSQFNHSLSGFSESSVFSSSASLQEPPPAHSGSHRPATIQRTTYDQNPVVPEPRYF